MSARRRWPWWLVAAVLDGALIDAPLAAVARCVDDVIPFFAHKVAVAVDDPAGAGAAAQ